MTVSPTPTFPNGEFLEGAITDSKIYPGTENGFQVYVPAGSFNDKQQYFWLHVTDVPNDSGAEDLAVDLQGNLCVAARMGV